VSREYIWKVPAAALGEEIPTISPPLVQRSAAQRMRIAVQCSTVQSSAVQCSAAQRSAVQCSAVQCSAVQCPHGRHLPRLLRGGAPEVPRGAARWRARRMRGFS
jgi:hypothetical protein